MVFTKVSDNGILTNWDNGSKILGDISNTKQPIEVQIFLSKPNGTIISKIPEAFNIKNTLKLGGIHEITFDIPCEIEKDFKLTKNPNIDIIRERFRILAKDGIREAWYIINKITYSSNEQKDSISVQAMLLPYQMNDALIKRYTTQNDQKVDTPKSADIVLEEVLSICESSWTLGYVNADFRVTYRSFDVNSKTLLDFIFEVAETFNALILWDTLGKKIHLYKPEDFGQRRGFKLRYGHYLKSLDKEVSSDEMVTRLKAFGKDDMTFSSINATGQNYIEDYSYFLFPFTYNVDANGNYIVTKSSDFMSDELALAITKYSKFIESKTGEFNQYVSQQTSIDVLKNNYQVQYDAKQSEIEGLNKLIDIKQSQNGQGAYTDQIKNLQKQIEDKTRELNEIKLLLDEKKSQYTNVVNLITNLRNDIKQKKESLFTIKISEEFKDYIITKEWSDSNYVYAIDLYNDAKKKFVDFKKPKTVIKMSLVNFLQVVEAEREWDKLQLGDIIEIEYEKLGISVEAKVIEFDFDYEQQEINLTIANVKDLETDEEKLVKLLYKGNSASTTIDAKQYIWDKGDIAYNTVNNLLNDVWDASKREIVSGVNNSVVINERGITISDSTDQQRFVRLTHGVIGITVDGGNNYYTAIDGTGVYAERVIGKLLVGEALTIDATGTDPRDSSKKIKTFVVNGTGVKISGLALEITSGEIEDEDSINLLDRWNDSAQTVDYIVSDNKLTPNEKEEILREWTSIKNEYNNINAQVLSYWNINTDFLENNNYKTAYDNLLNLLVIQQFPPTNRPLLVESNLSVTSDIDRSVFRQTFASYYSAKNILQQKIADKALSLVDDVQQNIDDIENNLVYKVEIYSTNGTAFKNHMINTTLQARVYRGSIDVTDTIDAGRFKWTRKSNDSVSDDLWNRNHAIGVKEINVTQNDVYIRATFNCEVL